MVQLRQSFDKVLVQVKQPTGQAFLKGHKEKKERKIIVPRTKRRKKGQKNTPVQIPEALKVRVSQDSEQLPKSYTTPKSEVSHVVH